MRPIDADALKQRAFADPDTTTLGEALVYVQDIDTAPTIDPEELRPKGEWKVYWCETAMIGHEYEVCSNCGCEILETNKFWNCDYCPNCGAKMG